MQGSGSHDGAAVAQHRVAQAGPERRRGPGEDEGAIALQRDHVARRHLLGDDVDPDAHLRNLARGEAYKADAPVLWDIDFRGVQGESAPMAPIAWDGMVFIGNAGGDNIGVRGHVHALDAATGRELWRFDVVPDTWHARRSWPAGNDVPPTGGGMWSSFTLDPGSGTGNRFWGLQDGGCRRSTVPDEAHARTAPPGPEM